MIAAILTAVLLSSSQPAMSAPPAKPIVIAHRGASGERPEHTRAAYELAIEQGADFIEPDLVMTRDGHLVVRHENEIDETTDIADRPEFADRRTTRAVDGVPITGWFTEDFTLAELKTLRARERRPALRPASAAFDGQEPILTFDEVVEIAREAGARAGRVIGVAPELKHPSHFAALDLPMEDAFVAALERHALTSADAPILIQCFEVGTLERLKARIDAPLLQLMQAGGGPADRPGATYAEMATPQGLAEIARYAEAVGVQDLMVVPRDDAGRALAASPLTVDAHAAGLKIVVWTFRAENLFLPAQYRVGDAPADHGDLTGWLKAIYALGVDAVFSDFPAAAVNAR
ncbi:glycerophosphodiester phosphodiesterase [Brevundimonas diminuta]|jgi:glycerophosphoryl diester phosphodiesterase|uniref:glycerophosphodiester phosphodiesterase n=1 Tax=Brevundimonas diminuta TaxID=293 RepID=A0A410P0W0_BREDI|nr:glycerophosphodiester phosphodiesterase [Brevundimonas diminuta]MBD3573184.1 glycerophosphodiester phosphodiesterase [Brevundimonas diminuta]QAT15699.1 glycerophosphodiester phosphodiesterase [Brevundimonas diminuta]QQB90084.1 glycerophosphodiester phosphodiesterase [Brevundimonas diminuta]GEB99455.1 glycerophosphoryl diester phosphodiesterase [Brevundimonas diminuta]